MIIDLGTYNNLLFWGKKKLHCWQGENKETKEERILRCLSWKGIQLNVLQSYMFECEPMLWNKNFFIFYTGTSFSRSSHILMQQGIVLWGMYCIDNISFATAMWYWAGESWFFPHHIDYYFNWKLFFMAAWSLLSLSPMLDREKQIPHTSCKQPLGWACFLVPMDKYCILKMVEKAQSSTSLNQLLL